MLDDVGTAPSDFKPCLLLGAGASVEAGVPAAVPFVAEVREHLHTLPPADAQPLVDTFDQVVSACATARVHANETEEVDLEIVYRAIDDALDRHFEPELALPSVSPDIIASRALERLEYEIKRCIQIRCTLDDARRIAYFVNLAKDIREYAPLPIVSLNYDNVIELFCEHCQLRLLDPVTTAAGESSFANTAASLPPPSVIDVLLLKLHGSVTWLTRKGNVTVLSEVGRNAIVQQLGELRSATLDTPLIYPTLRKLPISMPFLRNAALLQSVLAHTTCCIVGGYSFRDRHVVEWLSHGLKINRSLEVVIIDPDAHTVFRNLVEHDPLTAWADRVRIAEGKGYFGEAIARGLRQVAASARPLRDSRARRGNAPRLGMICAEQGIAGLAASPDGSYVYASLGADRGQIDAIELASGRRSIVTRKAIDPRGLAVSSDGRLYVVHNRLLRGRAIATRGLGSVSEIDLATGAMRSLSPLPFRDLIHVLRAGRTSPALEAFPNLLSWPTDVLVLEDQGLLLATEARALRAICLGTGATLAVSRPPLSFNLEAIDAMDDTCVFGLEMGIAQRRSWGRIISFGFENGKLTARTVFDEGWSRLFDICCVPSRNSVIVTQCLPWPKGGLIELLGDSFSLRHRATVTGLNMPEKIVYNTNWEFLIVSTGDGLVSVPLKAFD